MKELNTKICDIDENLSNRCNKLETELKDEVDNTEFVISEHKVNTSECCISEVLKCSDTQPNTTELTFFIQESGQSHREGRKRKTMK